MKLFKLYRLCRKSDTSFIVLIFRYIVYKLRGKEILAHHKSIIKGIENIETKAILHIGTSYFGFVHKNDITYLNVQGKLKANGNVSIGRGCRFDIGEKAIVQIGNNSSINPFSTFIIQHNLEIGRNCLISWSCQFLDEDFHKLEYEGKREDALNDIVIKDNVWIGSKVSVMKGTYIASGSVVASNSVVKGVFQEENVLIAGNPAKIVKRNISWEK